MVRFEWISTALPRRVVAVRMRTQDTLQLPRLKTPFAVLPLAMDAGASGAAVANLKEELREAGAEPVMGVGGPGADLWEDEILAAVTSLRMPKEAIAFFFDGSVLGMGIGITEFAVLCLDGNDADWREVLDATRGFVSKHVDWRLHAAANAGREHEVRQAIADGWPIDEFDSDLAETPLHKAARIGHLEIARMLLAAGADVNRHCEERIGETPLGLVADTCAPDLARLLMDAGADPTIRGWMGITALDRAAERTDEAGKEVLALLRAYPPKRRGP